MKYIIKSIFISLVFVTFFTSCNKDEYKIYYEGGTNPVLTADKTSLVLTDATKLNHGIKFSWTNPDYMFTTGVSSQTVNYILELDTTGANFNGKNRQSVALSGELNKAFTVGEINAILTNNMYLKTGMVHNLEARIKATLVNNTAILYSNVLKIPVTPFMPPPKVTPPATGNLWIVGSAVPSGWDASLPSPYDVSQKFTKVSNTLYTLTVDMIAGGGYKLLQSKGVWGTQYHAIDGAVVTGGDFELKDADPQFPAPAVSGKYKITIDFQYGKYYVEKV